MLKDLQERLGGWLGLASSSPVIGIDISSSAVKLLELSRSGQRYRVEGYAVTPLPPSAVVEKSIVEPGVVGEALRKASGRLRSRQRDAAVAVAGSAVITKAIDMPSGLSDDALETQITMEADQYIPYPLEEVALDFEVVGPSARSSDQVEVLLAACRQENIDQRVEVLELAELVPRVVDVEAFAMQRAFGLIAAREQFEEGAVVAIVDIGATMTTLSVLVDNETIYTREQLFGGRQLNEEIQRRYGMSPEEAQQAREEGNLPEDYELEVLEPFREAAVQQITRALQFFFSATQYGNVDRLVLAGGVAAMAGFADQVGEALDVSVLVANPFAEMEVASRVDALALSNDAPALMLACGLAMRSFS